VPRYDASVPRGLTEELVMPKPHRTFKELRRGNEKSRIPQKIVKPRHDAPRTQRVKQHAVRIAGFVRMVLVEEFAAFVRGIHEDFKFAAQKLHLLVGQDSHTG
jgi:hypothetical protein